MLISINLVVFALDHLLRFPLIKSLYLNQAHPALFQFVTSLFCHGSWGHLSGNVRETRGEGRERESCRHAVVVESFILFFSWSEFFLRLPSSSSYWCLESLSKKKKEPGGWSCPI